MKLGERLLELRKAKHLSQEEVADKLNVTRQTISKWETNQSTPDFDKIMPLCNLYEITSDELLTGNKVQNVKEEINGKVDNRKRAQGIGISVLLYFISVIWIMISIPVMRMNPILASAIFLLIIGIATFYIIYTCMVYKKVQKETKKNSLMKRIDNILSLIALIIYLIVSFITMAWHITWLIWIIYAIIYEIIKLLFSLRGDFNEE